MYSQRASVTTGVICEGCLSTDRKLTPVDEHEIRKLFSDTLDPLETSGSLNMCWECCAVIRRMVKFKRQVKQVNQYLLMYNNQPIPTLSNLSTYTSNSYIQIHEDTSTVDTVFNDVKETIDCKDFPIDNCECDVKDCLCMNKIHKDNMNDESDDDKLVIKEENDDGFNFDDEADYDNAESKPEDVDYLIPVTKKKKKTVKIQFDESDEEPLKLKKEKVEKELKKNEKKKDEIVVAEPPRRRGRERPSGVVRTARVARQLRELNVAPGQLEMVALSWEEVEAERQKALKNVKFTRHEYRCYDCVIGFNHRFKLEDHMKRHDPSAGTFVCSVCSVRCRSAHLLSGHRRRHRMRWRCVRCGALWSRAGVAADHHARAHGAPAPTHTCAVCGHTETSLAKLRNHIKNHAEREKCELCGKTFRDKTSLRTHLFIHKGEKEYACPKCDKKFLFKKAMQIHQLTHEVSAQLYCHECDMNFKNHMSYYHHMKYNLKHIDPALLKYACPLCPRRFAKEARLREHHTAVHLKLTPFACNATDCGFVCSSRTVLRTHTRMVHRNVRVVRNHVCDTCGKAYTTKRSLEGHLRSHTGERPFHCAHCHASFGYQAALYNHNRLVHQGNKKNRSRSSQPAQT